MCGVHLPGPLFCFMKQSHLCFMHASWGIRNMRWMFVERFMLIVGSKENAEFLIPVGNISECTDMLIPAQSLAKMLGKNAEC